MENTVSTEHTGLPVHGYKPQTDAKVAMVNANKELEERVLRQIEEVAMDFPDADLRWTAIAKTNIELGFMALNRAVFKPGRVKLPGDN
jgi:hypothetical protein